MTKCAGGTVTTYHIPEQIKKMRGVIGLGFKESQLDITVVGVRELQGDKDKEEVIDGNSPKGLLSIILSWIGS